MKTARKFTLNFVCFDCRASYGQPVLAHAGAAVRVCPTCRAPMTYVTPKYRPPRKADAKAWEVDRLLAKSNLLAYSPRFADGVPPALKVTRLAEAQVAVVVSVRPGQASAPSRRG